MHFNVFVSLHQYRTFAGPSPFEIWMLVRFSLAIINLSAWPQELFSNVMSVFFSFFNSVKHKKIIFKNCFFKIAGVVYIYHLIYCFIIACQEWEIKTLFQSTWWGQYMFCFISTKILFVKLFHYILQSCASNRGHPAKVLYKFLTGFWQIL